MPFETPWDGYLRRFSVLAPPDWMSVVELEGKSLPLFVILWSGRVADLLASDGVTVLEAGSPKASGAWFVLRPQAGDPTWASNPTDAAGNPTPPEDLRWPKFIGLCVEGIDPTEQPSRPYRNLSGQLEPHDLTAFEWMYTGTDVRLGDVELLKMLVNSVSAQLDSTWDAWYSGIKVRTIPVVDPAKVYLVAAGHGATFALEALADLMFHGAALVVGGSGGSFGGDVVSSPDVANREVRPPLPSADRKAIFCITGSRAHLGDPSDDATVDAPRPTGFSLRDLTAHGEQAIEAALDARREFSVIGSLRPWWAGMGYPDPVPGGTPPTGVLEAATGVAHGGYVRLWFDDRFASSAAGNYVPIIEIFNFFDLYG